MEVDKIDIKLTRQSRITKVIATGMTESKTIVTLHKEFLRCGYTMKIAQCKCDFHLLPESNIIIKDVPATWKLFNDVMGDFVEDIGFSLDKQVVLRHDLLDALFQLFENSKPAQKQNIGELMNYIQLEDWLGICDEPACNNSVTVNEVLLNTSLLCTDCIKKNTH